MCHAGREHVGPDENLIYARLCPGPWELAEQLEKRVPFSGGIFVFASRITDLGGFGSQRLVDWLSSRSSVCAAARADRSRDGIFP